MNQFFKSLDKRKVICIIGGFLFLAILILITEQQNTESNQFKQAAISHNFPTNASKYTHIQDVQWFRGDGYSLSFPMAWQSTITKESENNVVRFSPKEQVFNPIEPSLTVVSKPHPQLSITDEQKILEIGGYTKSLVTIDKEAIMAFSKLQPPPVVAHQTYGSGLIDTRCYLTKNTVQYEIIILYSKEDILAKQTLDAMLASINYQ